MSSITINPSTFKFSYLSPEETNDILSKFDLNVTKDYVKIMFFDELCSLSYLKNSKLGKEELKKIKKVFVNETTKNWKPNDISVYNSIKDEEYTVNVEKYFNRIKNGNYILALDDSVFDKGDSLFVDIIDGFLIERSTYKNLQKDAMRNKNESLKTLYEIYQKVFKEFANSLYGAMGLNTFFLFNIDVVSSVTGTCKSLLLQTITKYEEIFGGRVIIRNDKELMTYLTNINKKYLMPIDYEANTNELHKMIYLDFIDKSKEKKIGVKKTLKKILSFCKYNYTEYTEELITNVLNNHRDNYLKLMQFYYNANLEEFLDSAQVLIQQLVYENFDNLSSKKFDEHKFVVSDINKFFERFVKDMVFNKTLVVNALDICDNYQRKSVLLTDTDSTFVICKFLFDALLKEVNKFSKSNEPKLKKIVYAFRIIMRFGEFLSDDFLAEIGYNIQGLHDNRWKLKSEYLYYKILLMLIKKTYCGSILAQEGIVSDPMSFDHKNMEMTKSSYNPISKKFIEAITHSLVMTEDSLNFNKLFNLIKEHEEIARNTINVDNLPICGIPAKWKRESSFKEPYSIAAFVAGLFWNITNPRDKLNSHDKMFVIDLHSPIQLYKVNIKDKSNEEIYKELIRLYSEIVSPKFASLDLSLIFTLYN
jgi:DNA polymerase elongation subunit (family B)